MIWIESKFRTSLNGLDRSIFLMGLKEANQSHIQSWKA